MENIELAQRAEIAEVESEPDSEGSDHRSIDSDLLRGRDFDDEVVEQEIVNRVEVGKSVSEGEEKGSGPYEAQDLKNGLLERASKERVEAGQAVSRGEEKGKDKSEAQELKNDPLKQGHWDIWEHRKSASKAKEKEERNSPSEAQDINDEPLRQGLRVKLQDNTIYNLQGEGKGPPRTKA